MVPLSQLIGDCIIYISAEARILSRYISSLDPDDLDIYRHGNGFMQADLPIGARLHIWNPDLGQAQRIATPIHDHRFSFRSVVLYGYQNHWTYNPITTEDSTRWTHHVYQAQPTTRQSTELVPTGAVVSVGAPICYTIPAGESYLFEQYLFHETPIIEYAITVLFKLANDPDHATRVLCPIGSQPDNDYDRYSMDRKARLDQIRLAQRWLTS